MTLAIVRTPFESGLPPVPTLHLGRSPVHRCCPSQGAYFSEVRIRIATSLGYLLPLFFLDLPGSAQLRNTHCKIKGMGNRALKWPGIGQSLSRRKPVMPHHRFAELTAML